MSLSTGAARKALEKANISADQLGLILTATFTPDSFTPVSYTHLDVYKRQELSWRTGNTFRAR